MGIACMRGASVGLGVRMGLLVLVGFVCNVVAIVKHVRWLISVLLVIPACTYIRAHVLIPAHPNTTKIPPYAQHVPSNAHNASVL